MIADQLSDLCEELSPLDQVEELLTALPSTLGEPRDLWAEVRRSFGQWGPTPTAAEGRRRRRPLRRKFLSRNFRVRLCLAGTHCVSLALAGCRWIPLLTCGDVTPALHRGRHGSRRPRHARSDRPPRATRPDRRLLGSGRPMGRVQLSHPAARLRRLRSSRGADRDLLELLAPRRRRPQGMRLSVGGSLPVVRRDLPVGFPPPPRCPVLFSRRSGHSYSLIGAGADPKRHEKGTRGRPRLQTFGLFRSERGQPPWNQNPHACASCLLANPDLKDIHLPTFFRHHDRDRTWHECDRCLVSASDCRGLRRGWTHCWVPRPFASTTC